MLVRTDPCQVIVFCICFFLFFLLKCFSVHFQSDAIQWWCSEKRIRSCSKSSHVIFMLLFLLSFTGEQCTIALSNGREPSDYNYVPIDVDIHFEKCAHTWWSGERSKKQRIFEYLFHNRIWCGINKGQKFPHINRNIRVHFYSNSIDSKQCFGLSDAAARAKKGRFFLRRLSGRTNKREEHTKRMYTSFPRVFSLSLFSFSRAHIEESFTT